MKKIKRTLLMVGTVGLVFMAIAFNIRRFQQPDLTETQLFLWGIRYWWMWVPTVLALVVGCLIQGRSENRRKS